VVVVSALDAADCPEAGRPPKIRRCLLWSEGRRMAAASVV
jgi:hypothetical protein